MQLNFPKIARTLPLLLCVVLGAAVLSGCDNNGTGASTSLDATNIIGVYHCGSPEATLRLEAEKRAATTVDGNTIKGDWDIADKTVVLKSEEGSPLNFDVQSDGALVERRHGWKFERTSHSAGSDISGTGAASKSVESAYAGVYLCQSPATILRLEADKSAGMMINGSPFEGQWKIGDGHDIIEFSPNVGASSRFAVQSDGSLQETKYGYRFEKLPAR